MSQSYVSEILYSIVPCIIASKLWFPPMSVLGSWVQGYGLGSQGLVFSPSYHREFQVWSSRAAYRERRLPSWQIRLQAHTSRAVCHVVSPCRIQCSETEKQQPDARVKPSLGSRV
eukprot:1370812-Rhodomonas_salina.1